MNNIINLGIVPSMLGGYTGVQDYLNPQFTANAKQSLWATLEQNSRFEQNLLLVYRAYLEEVANSNNGYY